LLHRLGVLSLDPAPTSLEKGLFFFCLPDFCSLLPGFEGSNDLEGLSLVGIPVKIVPI
jgi:hypothetical protein